ncbi:MAG TPA: helix-turn-helix domain-containing protein [Myxococcales bacterium]|nr:helix-turn-helix domain-containing protein [Myxococcales bacterium]
MLTTTEAAEIAGVAPSTLKRWADQGLLPIVRTPGGHRRFERDSLDLLLQTEAGAGAERPAISGWIRCLLDGQRHEIDGRLLEARSRLGTWCSVADELGAALVELGEHWECGRLTVADEHAASDALARALARVGDALPVSRSGNVCLLACAGDEEHTLGLSLAELTLREVGWAPLWLGRRTPVAEIVRVAKGGRVGLVALSASLCSSREAALRDVVKQVGAACAEQKIGLVLGGAGAWPQRPARGVRLTSFVDFHDYLALKRRTP